MRFINVLFTYLLTYIYLRFEKSQRSVMHDSLCYINILTYLLTYLIFMSVHIVGIITVSP